MSASSQPADSEQVVLILVGLVASGKSTFAQALEQHFPYFRRCNQDDLGSRALVENLARQSLSEGLSVCIDRTNIDAGQRAHWIKIAREFGASIWAIVFDTPYDLCAARLQDRTSHPTIKTPEDGLRVLSIFGSSFQEPHPQEGHERLLVLRPSDHITSTYNHSDISSILQRLRESPAILSSTSPNMSAPHSFRRGYPRRVFHTGYPRGSQGPPQGFMGNLRGRAFRRGNLSDIAASVRGDHKGIVSQGEPSSSGRPSDSSDWRGSAQDPVIT